MSATTAAPSPANPPPPPAKSKLEEWEKNLARVIAVAILVSIWYGLHLQIAVGSLAVHYLDGSILVAVVAAWGYVQKAAGVGNATLLQKGAEGLQFFLGWKHLRSILNVLLAVAALLLLITRSIYLRAPDSKTGVYRVDARANDAVQELYVNGADGPKTAGTYFFLGTSGWRCPTMSFSVKSPAKVTPPASRVFFWGRPIRLLAPDDFPPLDLHLLRVIPGRNLFDILESPSVPKKKVGTLYYLHVVDAKSGKILASTDDWRMRTLVTGSTDEKNLQIDHSAAAIQPYVNSSYPAELAAGVAARLASRLPDYLKSVSPFTNQKVLIKVGRTNGSELSSTEEELSNEVTNVVVDVPRR
jgi:hypothetical protein